MHRDRCLAHLPDITHVFHSFPNDPDAVLNGLDEIEDIGLVIASGVIFSANRGRYLLFDQYTMGYALQLGIIPNHQITNGNYGTYSDLIVRYIAGHAEIGSIEEFVRAANDTLFPFSPG